MINTSPASVTFSFSSPITEFYLDVGRILAPDEFLTGFNIGDPTTLTGDLVNLGGNVTTTRIDDFGSGRLAWTGINTSTVSFTIGNLPGSTNFPAMAINQFGIDDGAAIPEPSSASTLGITMVALISISIWCRRHRVV